MFKALRADNSPFTGKQIEQLQASLNELQPAQSAWLSGYIAGCLASNVVENVDTQSVLGEPVAQEKFHVFYASQTGTGEAIASQLAERLQQSGWLVELQSMAGARPAQLKKLKRAAVVISTHGEGDPPDDALDWFDYLQGKRAPRLEGLQFSVLALGDRSYEKYCEAGVQLEQLLLATGAKVFSQRVDCDLDYTGSANQWSEQVLDFARQQQPAVEPLSDRSAANRLKVVPSKQLWNRANPFKATVERVQKITALESEKDVYHLELSLEDSRLEYLPGDSLGVWAHNNHDLVSDILQRLDIAADEELEIDGQRHTAHELLTRHRELTRLSADTVLNYAAATAQPGLQLHFDALDSSARREFIEQRQFIDLLEEYPPLEAARLGLPALAELLRPLAPRSYSIASSQQMVGEEVHLTVATLHSNAIGKQRSGVASEYLNHQLQAGDEIGVFLEPNRRFRLPENATAPVILIAAGTGIAPYRAFLQQLEEEDSQRPVWLIFGNPHLRSDFLYQREWLDWRQKGLLQRIDGAFSRDQAEKRYVQHVIHDQSERVEKWLQDGAHVYLCGGLAMGREVESALAAVLQKHRDLDEEAATRELIELRKQGRLLKDLY